METRSLTQVSTLFFTEYAHNVSVWAAGLKFGRATMRKGGTPRLYGEFWRHYRPDSPISGGNGERIIAAMIYSNSRSKGGDRRIIWSHAEEYWFTTFKGLGLHFQSLQRSSSLMRMRITHTMNTLAGGKSRGQTGGLEMHWQAYRLPGLKFNSRSYGRNLLWYHLLVITPDSNYYSRLKTLIYRLQWGGWEPAFSPSRATIQIPI